VKRRETTLATPPLQDRSSTGFITGESSMGTHNPQRPPAAAFIVAAAMAAGLAAAAPVTASAASSPDPDARCRRLEARITQLQARLRLGYTARQGRLWRQQLAALEAERRAACRWRGPGHIGDGEGGARRPERILPTSTPTRDLLAGLPLGPPGID
jgi:hypothetical protein